MILQLLIMSIWSRDRWLSCTQRKSSLYIQTAEEIQAMVSAIAIEIDTIERLSLRAIQKL